MATSLPAPTTARPARTHRFHLLDALRGIFAMLVAFHHSPAYLTRFFPTENIFLAVDFFFCLSGFVMSYAYEESLRNGMRLRDFMAARIIRFYPTFLFGTALAFFFALGPGHLLSHAGGHILAGAALTSLLFLPCLPLPPRYVLFPMNMSVWTLFLELIANFGFALIVRSKRSINAILIAICVGSWCVLAFAPRPLDSGSTWPGALVGLARMSFSFPLGVCVQHVWQRCTPQGRFRRTRGLPTAVTIAILLLAVVLIPSRFSDHRIYQLVVIMLALPGFIFFGADIRLGRAEQKVCDIFGALSYPMYIVHLPLLSPLFGARAARLVEPSSLLRHILAPAYILLLAAFAWALRTCLDIPIGRWLTRVYKSRVATPSRTPVTAPQPVLTPPETPSPATEGPSSHDLYPHFDPGAASHACLPPQIPCA